MNTEALSLKWGTLKSWRLETDKSREIAKKYIELGSSKMMQKDSPEQKQLICDLIDAVDCDTIFLDWEGKDVSKDRAKEYVMGYKNKLP